MPFSTEVINRQALQQALGNMFKVGEDSGNSYRISYGGNNLWKPIADVPLQYSYRSPGQARTGTGLEALVNVLKQQYVPQMQSTTPNYYEYKSQQQPSKASYFAQLYGFNNFGNQLSGGQKVYQPVWEQASWMKPQDRQSFLQEKAQAPQQLFGNKPRNDTQQNLYGNELSNLNMLTSMADSRNIALTDTINRAVSSALAKKGNENYMADMYWGQR